MNIMMIIKYSSTVMYGKKKLCECHTRFFWEFNAHPKISSLDESWNVVVYI